MSLTYKVVLVWVICLSYKVVITGCEVVLVNRNVTDSFRVGRDGCTNNASVCPSSATCQSDGSCLCSSKRSTYRNPDIKIMDSKIVYGDSYGCVHNPLIRSGVGLFWDGDYNEHLSLSVGNIDTVCYFSPFQVIPYSYKDPVTKFSDDNLYVALSCSLTNAWAKFPDNATEMEVQWLNESYVNFTIVDKTLHIKWKRSVPDLQGTIITFNFTCRAMYADYIRTCLRAKVLGTWSADTSTTDHSPPLITSPSTKPTTSGVSTDTTMTTLPTTSARSSPPGEISSNDGDSSGTIIAIAIAVPIALLIVLVVVVWLVCKRKRGNSQRNSSGGSSGKEKGTTSTKEFSRTDTNLRGPDAYDDVPGRDTTQTFSNHLNPAYATPHNQSVVVEANPAYEAPGYETPDVERKEINVSNSHLGHEYETPDFKRREINGDNSYPDPGYETPDIKKREVSGDNFYTDPGYETAEVKRKEVNEATSDSAYSIPDSDIRNEEANAGLSTSDIERTVVNGDLYALPDKNRNSKK